ncbi:hypothetical protein ACFX2I_001852 [Malus domestica]
MKTLKRNFLFLAKSQVRVANGYFRETDLLLWDEFGSAEGQVGATKHDLGKNSLQMEREVVADCQLVPAFDTSLNCYTSIMFKSPRTSTTLAFLGTQLESASNKVCLS